MMWHFTVPGDPIPKARPRVYGRHAFTPRRTLDYETRVRLAFLTAYPGVRPIPAGIPVEVACEFRRATHRKADVDNLLKSVMDALNGVAWDDDRQVCHAIVTRLQPGEYQADR